MKKRISSAFLSTLTLVSRIPVRTTFTPDHSWTGLFLPVVGVAAALVAAAGYLAGCLAFGDWFLGALTALVLQYALFNLFHFDGLLDSADALFCYADREKRLAILKDSRIGSFAFFVGFVCAAAKLYLLYRLPATMAGAAWVHGGGAGGAAHGMPAGGVAGGSGRAFPSVQVSGPSGILSVLVGLAAAGFFAYPVVGRAAAALVPCFLRPARKDGLGASLGVYSPVRAAAGTIIAIAAAWLPPLLTGAPLRLLVAAPAGIAVGCLAVALPYARKIGGFTGDALGAAVELGELAYLAAFLALGLRG